MSSDYKVISADITVLTTRIATARISEGPLTGELFMIPRSVFQDPDLLEKGDDEISVATWWAEKNNLGG